MCALLDVIVIEHFMAIPRSQGPSVLLTLRLRLKRKGGKFKGGISFVHRDPSLPQPQVYPLEAFSLLSTNAMKSILELPLRRALNIQNVCEELQMVYWLSLPFALKLQRAFVRLFLSPRDWCSHCSGALHFTSPVIGMLLTQIQNYNGRSPYILPLQAEPFRGSRVVLRSQFAAFLNKDLFVKYGKSVSRKIDGK